MSTSIGQDCKVENMNSTSPKVFKLDWTFHIKIDEQLATSRLDLTRVCTDNVKQDIIRKARDDLAEVYLECVHLLFYLAAFDSNESGNILARAVENEQADKAPTITCFFHCLNILPGPRNYIAAFNKVRQLIKYSIMHSMIGQVWRLGWTRYVLVCQICDLLTNPSTSSVPHCWNDAFSRNGVSGSNLILLSNGRYCVPSYDSQSVPLFYGRIRTYNISLEHRLLIYLRCHII